MVVIDLGVIFMFKVKREEKSSFYYVYLLFVFFIKKEKVFLEVFFIFYN